MCEHCGCRQVEPIARLMDEHFDLLDMSSEVRTCLAAGDRNGAWAVLANLATHLVDHVQREEAGVFRALVELDEFVETVRELEGEHRDFDEAISDLDLAADDFEERVGRLLADLSLHIDKENLGIFPVAVVSLNAHGWDLVSAAHERTSVSR